MRKKRHFLRESIIRFRGDEKNKRSIAFEIGLERAAVNDDGSCRYRCPIMQMAAIPLRT